jgi:hypothetical protein
MTSATPKKVNVDTTRIGEHAALQPLSGISRVDETAAVNGLGRGGFVRKEEAKKAVSRR